MPKWITNQQVRIYMEERKKQTQKIAAAKSGFSERSARNIEKRGFSACQKSRQWKTRQDPFEGVWEDELVPLLEQQPTLQAKTLHDYLQRLHPSKFPDQTNLRTLYRRVSEWKAIHGPEKEVIFRQNHPPGWQGISDFTCCDALKVTIQGEEFPHLLYHYRLAFSGWEHAQVILGGESFTAVSEGLQNALWLSGGVPETHRTDSLSAAYKNLPDKAKEDFTRDYTELCAYYQMEPTRNNKGVSHENGTIEAVNGHLKNRIDQELIMRGSREFQTVEDYRSFIDEIIKRHNRQCEKKLAEERKYLKELPERKTREYTPTTAVVTSMSTIRVKDVIYSVYSRLINKRLKIHLYDDRLECYLGVTHVLTLRRERNGKKRKRKIDYRHIIPGLVKKPQAFRNYVYREEMFPTLALKQAWEVMNQNLDSRTSCREFVMILREASRDEKRVNEWVEECLIAGKIPRLKELQKGLERREIQEPAIHSIDLEDYEELLTGGIQ